MRLAYLFSRYPVVSQTFCDTEILALEKLGLELELYSIYPPPTSFRHGHFRRMRASLHYAPPPPVLKLGETLAKAQGRWPAALIAEHERRYGPEYKSALRARNALYFADLFQRRGLTHFHVHFANRAAHTAIFVKAISGIPFSISTHGQDFMSDLGNDDLLREICREAVFVANETEYSKNLVAGRCPDSAEKMHRVFNGMDLANFPPPPPLSAAPPLVRLVSTGRLIEFKGFHHLIPACAALRDRGLAFACDIIGEGPWRAQLQEQIDRLQLGPHVRLLGSLPQEEVFGALHGCDIFALACTTDAKGATDVFPTVILEAMASGKPVVSTRLAGVPEQIAENVSGLLVDPGDEAALADALASLITSPELRRRLGAAARERLEREFSVEQTVQPLRRLFEEHVAPAPAAPTVRTPLAGLLGQWPPDEAVSGEIRQLRAIDPTLRVFAAEAESAKPADADLLPVFNFLPDGMVLEGEWQQERDLARRLETWRVELGQKLSSESFLQHARRALYLSRLAAGMGMKHLHVWDASELLTAYLAYRLGGPTFSVSVREGHALPAIFAKLTGAAAGLRSTLPERAWKPLAAELPPGLAVLQAKPKRPLEPEWLQSLARWSQR